MSNQNWINNASNAYMQLLNFIENTNDDEFKKDASEVIKEIKRRYDFWSNYKPRCINCDSYRKADAGLMCAVYGYFPDNINPCEYLCNTWKFDDIPF